MGGFVRRLTSTGGTSNPAQRAGLPSPNPFAWEQFLDAFPNPWEQFLDALTTNLFVIDTARQNQSVSKTFWFCEEKPQNE